LTPWVEGAKAFGATLWASTGGALYNRYAANGEEVGAAYGAVASNNLNADLALAPRLREEAVNQLVDPNAQTAATETKVAEYQAANALATGNFIREGAADAEAVYDGVVAAKEIADDSAQIILAGLSVLGAVRALEARAVAAEAERLAAAEAERLAAAEAERLAAAQAERAAAEVAPSSTVRVFRVEGAPNARIAIGEGGTVAVANGDQMLFLNFGDKARAEAFLAKRLQQGMPGATAKSFEVPTSFLDELRASAVPEALAGQNPGSPIIVDVTKAADQIGLRSEQIEVLKKAIIQGSGKTGLD
jgi:hypothetical protein